MRPNTYTDALYASQRLRDLEDGCPPHPLLGLAVLTMYGALLGLFVYWVLP